MLYALRGGSYDSVVSQEEALAIWLFLSLGFALGLLPRARLPRGAAVPLTAVGLLAAWTALSLSWTQTDEGAFNELARVVHLGAIPLLVWSLVDRQTWRAAAAGVAAGAVTVCALSVASRIWPGAFPTDELRTLLADKRLNYPFDYENAVSAWGAMSLTIVIAWSAASEHRRARIAALASAPVCGLAVYLSYSRAGAVAVAIGLVVAFVLGPRRPLLALHALVAAAGVALVVLVARGQPIVADGAGAGSAGTVAAWLITATALCGTAAAATWAVGAGRWRMSAALARRALAIGAAVLVIGAAVLAADGQLSNAWSEFRDAGTVPSAVAPESRLGSLGSNRYDLWSSALDAFQARPLQGVGAGSFEFWWSGRTPLATLERNAHSVLFGSLAELGLLGLGLVLAFLGGLLAVSVRVVRGPPAQAAATPLLACFAVYLFYASADWMWQLTAVSALGLTCAALTASAGASAEAGARSARPRRLVRTAVVLLAALACAVQLPGLVSTSKLRDSQAAFRAGDARAAAANADDAVGAQPWAASPYIQRALLAEARGDLDAARADVLRAINRERTNWRHRLILARVEARDGHPAASLRALGEARRLRPQSNFYVP